jgi:hypothetical protein
MTGYLVCGFMFGEDEGSKLVHAIEAELALKKEQAAADLGTADGAHTRGGQAIRAPPCRFHACVSVVSAQGRVKIT